MHPNIQIQKKIYILKPPILCFQDKEAQIHACEKLRLTKPHFIFISEILNIYTIRKKYNDNTIFKK